MGRKELRPGVEHHQHADSRSKSLCAGVRTPERCRPEIRSKCARSTPSARCLHRPLGRGPAPFHEKAHPCQGGGGRLDGRLVFPVRSEAVSSSFHPHSSRGSVWTPVHSDVRPVRALQTFKRSLGPRALPQLPGPDIRLQILDRFPSFRARGSSSGYLLHGYLSLPSRRVERVVDLCGAPEPVEHHG